MGYYIDGTNLTCYVDKEEPRLDALLSLLVEFKKRNEKFTCIFDAGMDIDIYLYNTEELPIIYTLLKDRKRFTKCPGGTEADEFILDASKKDKLPIITNDRYRDHRKEKHKWIPNDRKKERGVLLKSAVITSPDEEKAYLNVIDLGINIPVQSDLDEMLIQLGLSKISQEELEKKIKSLSSHINKNGYVPKHNNDSQNQRAIEVQNLQPIAEQGINAKSEMLNTSKQKEIAITPIEQFSKPFKKLETETINSENNGANVFNEIAKEEAKTRNQSLIKIPKKKEVSIYLEYNSILKKIETFDGRLNEYKKLAVESYNVEILQRAIQKSKDLLNKETDFNTTVLSFVLNYCKAYFASFNYIKNTYIAGMHIGRSKSEIDFLKMEIVKIFLFHRKQLNGKLDKCGVKEFKILAEDRANSYQFLEFLKNGGDGPLPRQVTIEDIQEILDTRYWDLSDEMKGYMSDFEISEPFDLDDLEGFKST